MSHKIELIDDSLAVVKVSRDMETGRREVLNQLRDICRELINEKQRNLIVDFKELNICPSLVWGNLLVLSKQARESQYKIGLCSLRPTLAKSVKIIGLSKYMNIYSEKSEAVKALRKEDEHE